MRMISGKRESLLKAISQTKREGGNERYSHSCQLSLGPSQILRLLPV
jgi:hypothetical protein